MKYSEDIKPITYMKTKSADLVEKVTTTQRPVIITQNGEARVIVQDIQSYERTRDALLLLQFLNRRSKEAKKGKLIPHEQVMARLAKKYGKKSV